MNTQAVTQMKLMMAQVEQLWPFGRIYELVDSIYEDSHQASLYMPDFGIDCTGRKAIKDALRAISGRIYGQFHIFHTCSEKQEEETGYVYGHWNTYTYTLLSNSGEESGRVQFSFWRFWVQCSVNDGVCRIQKLSVLELLHMSSLEYSPLRESVLFDNGAPVSGRKICSENKMNPDEYVRLRNFLNRFYLEKPSRQKEWMACTEETSLDIPYLMSEPTLGYSEVCRALERLQELEDENEPLYPWKVIALSDPGIEKRGGRLRASSMALIFQFRGKAYGIEQAPYPLCIRVGLMETELVWEQGLRVVSATYTPYINLEPQEYDERVAPRTKHVVKQRQLPVRQDPQNVKAQDIYEIESLLAEWTERVKRKDLEEFVDLYMVNGRKELAIHLSTSAIGYPAVKAKAHNLICGVLEEREYMYKYPQFHNGSVPVIEINEDGQMAEAAWIDYCWGNIGAEVLYEENCKKRQYFPGAGVYYHYFVKDNGKWKLYQFCTRNDGILGLPLFDYEAGGTGGWSSSSTKQPWPLPFEDFHYEGEALPEA